MAAAVVIEAMQTALIVGSTDPDVVAIEARRLEGERRPAPVVAIRPDVLATRALPRLDHYDELLSDGPLGGELLSAAGKK